MSKWCHLYRLARIAHLELPIASQIKFFTSMHLRFTAKEFFGGLGKSKYTLLAREYYNFFFIVIPLPLQGLIFQYAFLGLEFVSSNKKLKGVWNVAWYFYNMVFIYEKIDMSGLIFIMITIFASIVILSIVFDKEVLLHSYCIWTTIQYYILWYLWQFSKYWLSADPWLPPEKPKTKSEYV